MTSKQAEKIAALERDLKNVELEIPYLRGPAYRRGCARRDKVARRLDAIRAKVAAGRNRVIAELLAGE